MNFVVKTLSRGYEAKRRVESALNRHDLARDTRTLREDGRRTHRLSGRSDGDPKSTIHGHLATLRARQFVIKRGDTYCFGPELVRLGNYARTRKEEFVPAREFAEKLFEEIGFRATFAVEMGEGRLYPHGVRGEGRMSSQTARK